MPGVIPVTKLGQIGAVSVTDVPPHELPLNAWTTVQNMRCEAGAIKKMLGHQVHSTPTVAPYFLLPMKVGATYYWVYAGLARLKNWDGAAENDITRGAGAYNAAALTNWTGNVLGGIAILNNGVDAPQSWAPGGLATDLANWPANYIAGAMRGFRRYLVGLDITKATGTRYAQMVKWSDVSPVGAVPSSWDETDTTKDAGEYELKDTNGACVDLVRLRDMAVIYKEDSVAWMQYVGGVDIFKFPSMFGDFGILSRRCAVEYNRGLHAVFALGDIIKHDGQSWQSIIDSRLRKFIFNQIDATNYATSYVVNNPAFFEVWFCFPTSGNTLPNLALVWNWKYDTLGFRDLIGGFAHITAGNVILPSSGAIWANRPETWASAVGVWGAGTSQPGSPRLMMADTNTPKLQLGDSTSQYNGVNYTAMCERVGIGLPVEEDGAPDFQMRKFIRNLWPRITGTVGGTVYVQWGTQDQVGGAVTWNPNPFPYIIGTTDNVDLRVNTRLLALRFFTTDTTDWALSAYEAEVVKVSKF